MTTLFNEDLYDAESGLLKEPSSGIGMAPSRGGAPAAEKPQTSEWPGVIGMLQKGLWGYSDKESAQARAKMKEREVSRQELTVGITALKEGVDMTFGLDGDQRASFVKTYKEKLDKFDAGLGDAFANLAANPDTAGAISEWAQESETLKRAIQAGGLKGAKKLLTSPEALKTIQAEIDSKRMPILLRKGQTFIAGWQQLVPPEMAQSITKDDRVSASELITANEWLKANKPDVAKTLAFTDRDLEVVARNSDAFYHSLGIVSPKDEGQVLVDKAKGENKVKPTPDRTIKKKVGGEVVDQLQEWDGTKWVDKGDATPHFKPTDPEAADKRTVEVELKLSDDYRQDTRLFSDLRSQFDSTTDYMAKRKDGKTSAGDSALLYAYAKMRNPRDSRLAVQETTDLKKLGNIFERFQASAVGVLEKGETLPDRVANDMYAEIRRAFTEHNRAQLKVEADYTKKTKDYKGNPERVVRSYAIPEKDLAGTGDKPKGGVGGKYADPGAVRDAFQAGKITREQAREELKKFGFR
jgi:hypothetical protein